MAGDWIAMRCDLATDPAVIAISLELDMDEDAVVGKLHKLWSWFDQHTENGRAKGVTSEWINRFLRTEKFAEAMQNADWLAFNRGACVMPRFTNYNGKSGKSRILANRRKSDQRSRNSHAESVTQTGTREQNSTVPNRSGKEPEKNKAGGVVGPVRKDELNMAVTKVGIALNLPASEYGRQRSPLRSEVLAILERCPEQFDDCVALAAEKANAPNVDNPASAWWAACKRRWPVLGNGR